MTKTFEASYLVLKHHLHDDLSDSCRFEGGESLGGYVKRLAVDWWDADGMDGCWITQSGLRVKVDDPINKAEEGITTRLGIGSSLR